MKFKNIILSVLLALVMLPAFAISGGGGGGGSSDDEMLVSTETISITNAFPNPASSFVSFKYQLKSGSDVKITFHNLLGNVVAEYKLSAFDDQVEIPLEHFKAGVYFYTISEGNKNLATKKIIVKK